MASTYSNLKIQLMATGENTGTWGAVTNVNLGTALEEAVVGSADVTFNNADVTLTLTDTNASQPARHLRLVLTGTTNAVQQLIVPAIQKIYVVKNELPYACTVRVSGGSSVSVPSYKTMWLYSTGVDIVDVVTYLSGLSLGSPLPALSGGTGVNSVGTAGNVLTSNGTAWTSAALPTLGTMSSQNANAVAITGGTMAGVTVTGGTINALTTTSLGTNGYGTRTVSTGSPTGGADGDIWYKV